MWANDICRSQPDNIVLATATNDGRIVVTEDRDYGNLVFRDGFPALGIVISKLELLSENMTRIMTLLCDKIDTLGSSLEGKLTTIEYDRIRQRDLKSGN